MRAILAALALAALATSVSAKPQPAPQVAMGAIQARFFHYHKGELSGDVLADGDGYSGWNTVIGEGASGEPADDLLVLVPLTAAGEVFSDTPLEIRVTGEKGKVLGKRRFDGILIGGNGRAHMALWLNDVGCAGPLAIEARMGSQLRKASMTLACGE